MLLELTITNFAIIDKLHLTFHQGFNVLTGETGAGKSIIIDAVSLLLGGRAATDVIRAGTDSAFVEGVFHLSPDLQKEIDPVLEAEGVEGDSPDTLLLAREIRATGRNFCRVNGRTVSLGVLEQVAAPLIDIHGQHHHLSLLQVKQHQAFLDRYAGLERERENVARAFGKLQTARRELKSLQDNAQQIARRIDQLTFQVEEIQVANLKPGEEADLMIERTRLANAERLNQAAGEAYRFLVEGVDEQSSVSDLLGQVVQQLNALQRIDQSTEGVLQLAETISYQVEDLSGQLQAYAEEIEFSPERLQEVEERLGMIYNLKRKYGDSIEEILAFGQRAEAELKSISQTEDRIEALQAEVETLRKEVGELAAKLSEKRQEAGYKLGRGAEAELQELGMEQTKFVVNLERVPRPDGVYVGDETFACDENGIDRVEFLISPNPGEPLKPMNRIASGGETSRLMLALKTVLAMADETPTLIFDEIDQGIGGRVGGVVGRKLWGLAHRAEHQVLCVTHLAQIAAFGDNHYRVTKHIKDQRTLTNLEHVAGELQIEELAQMLGALSEATRLSATELLDTARAHKEESLQIMNQAALL
jgi:DNA repair protein RecN (Recombination protein N)